MIKVQNNIAAREPIPAFLQGLAPESLADLSWTDPTLGVRGCAWWPEVDQSPVLSAYTRYGSETLTVDAKNKRVIVVRQVVPWPQSEIDAAVAQQNARMQSELAQAVQAHLDGVVQTRNYDGIMSACTYLGSGYPKFSAESKACINWRDAVWAKCYEIMGAVQSGKRQPPTKAELIAELPVIVWPS